MHLHRSRFFLLSVSYALLASALLPKHAFADREVQIELSSGTGFIVNPQGDIVTNLHVLKDCQQITARLKGREVPIKLRAYDASLDLAVLRLPSATPIAAPFRWNIHTLAIGEPVVLMGYPGQEGVAGHYRFRTSTVIALKGPRSQPGLLQLAHVAEHGNSGGPVLDRAGNVIGVLTGNTEYIRSYKNANGETIGAPQTIGTSDVVIHLSVLEDFLRTHQIPYSNNNPSGIRYSDEELLRRANRFTLPIRCYQRVVPTSP